MPCGPSHSQSAIRRTSTGLEAPGWGARSRYCRPRMRLQDPDGAELAVASVAESLRDRADLLLIDAAPLLPVGDSIALSAYRCPHCRRAPERPALLGSRRRPPHSRPLRRPSLGTSSRASGGRTSTRSRAGSASPSTVRTRRCRSRFDPPAARPHGQGEPADQGYASGQH